MKNEEQDPFLEKARQALDNSVEDLDPDTQDKLNQIRRNALTEPGTKARPVPPGWWGPVGGIATAAVVATVWLTNPAPAPQPLMSDMELLTSEEDLEMMEDIEFVAWLMEQEDENAG